MWGLGKFRLCNSRDEFIFISLTKFFNFQAQEILTGEAVLKKTATWSDIPSFTVWGTEEE